MEASRITAVSNGTIKNVCLLKQKKERDEKGLFLVEGAKMLSEAVSSNMSVKEIFATEKAYSENKDLISSAKAIEYIVSDNVMDKLSEWTTPQGIVCVIEKKHFSTEDIRTDKKVFLLILDGVSDPGNIGTIVRTSEAAGIDAIITTEGTADCFQSKALRASMGSIFRVPVIEAENRDKLIDFLKSKGISVVATSLKGENIFDFDIKDRSLAVVFGNEANGISNEFSANADCLVKLPMEGKVESLNVAISAGIIMYLLHIK